MTTTIYYLIDGTVIKETEVVNGANYVLHTFYVRTKVSEEGNITNWNTIEGDVRINYNNVLYEQIIK